MEFDGRAPAMSPQRAAPAAAFRGAGTIGLADRMPDDAEPRRDADMGLAPLAAGMGARFEDVLGDYFARQARLPPAGGGAFDPRLTPVWLGQKQAF
jgi:hypothetical protein